MSVRTAIVATLLSALTACACDTVPEDAIEDCEASQVIAGAVKTDILFVIDDSLSMDEEQALLQAGLAAFVTTLATSPISNQFQIGVTTTSVEDFDGTPRAPAGDLVGPVLVSTSATLVADFQGQVAAGTSGSAREQPFEAAKRALLKTTGANAALLRPGARLAIIFLSDEDDCSGPMDPTIPSSAACRAAKVDAGSTLMSIGSFASFLGGSIRGEVRDVVVAAIVGVAPGTLALSCGQPYCSNQACSTATDKGDRFVQLLGAIGGARTRLASICDASFDQALSDFAAAMMSQTLPLDGAVADYRMLVAKVTRGGASVGCTIAHADAPSTERNAADAVYEPPLAGRPASLTFQNDCALQPGDAVSVGVVCVR
jgi:hypothetical protein